ncbi:hypothetical protein HYY75_04780, partial [bacterium]|nr:hypothetical protein [bacterium]
YPLVEAAIALTLMSAFLGAGISPNFIAHSSWGTIWLVVSVLWVRGEVSCIGPFIWPILYRILFSLWLGKFSYPHFFLVLSASAIFSLIGNYKINCEAKPAFFSLSFMGLISTVNISWGYPIALIFISLAYRFSSNPYPSSKYFGRALLFFWGVFGMIICGMRGDWGF